MKFSIVRAPIRILLAIVSIPFWIGFAVTFAPLYFGESLEFDVTTPLFVILPPLLGAIAITGKVPVSG